MIFKDVILFALISFGVISALGLLGKTISSLFVKHSESKPHFNFLTECVLGTVCAVLFYSAFHTGLVTINFGFLILLSFLLFVNKNMSNYRQETHARFKEMNTSIYLRVFVLSLLISFFNVIYPLPGSIQNDVLFYTKVAECLDRVGYENMYHEYNDLMDIFNGTFPYHYFELWMGSILFKCLGGFFTNIIIFKYVCYTTLKVFSVLGLLMLIENFKRIISWTDIFLVSVFSLFNFLYITEIGTNGWILYHDMWLRPNMVVYMFFLSFFFNFLITKEYANAVLFCLFLPVATITTAPAILSGMCLLVIFLFIGKKIQRKSAVVLISAVLVLTAFILAFYSLTTIDTSILMSDSRSLPELIEHSLSMIKAILSYLVSLPLRTLSMLLVPCLILFLLLKNWKEIVMQNSPLIISALLIAFSGIALFQVFPFLDDTFQFPYVGYAACSMVALILLYQAVLHTSLFSRNKTVTLIFMAGFFAFNLFHLRKQLNFELNENTVTELDLQRMGVHKDFFYKIEKYLSVSDERMGGFIIDKIDLSELSIGHRRSLDYQLGNYLAYARSDFFLVALTAPELLHDLNLKNSRFYERVYGFNSLTPFYKKKSSDDYRTELKSYLLKNDIHVLMSSKNFSQEAFDLRTKEVCLDEYSGHKFIILEK